MRLKWLGSLLLFALVFIGVTQAWAGEDDIRKAFVSLQKAIKACDAESIWGLIDTDSQSDANRAGKAVQSAFSKAGDKD